MKRLLMTVLIPAFTLGALIASPAMAQDKAKAAKAEKGTAARKVLLENDKVQAFQVTYKPGDENPAIPSSSFRILRVLQGGTLMRTFADGKTQNVEWKTGEVKFFEPDKVAFKSKNVGKTDVTFYVVVLKQAK